MQKNSLAQSVKTPDILEPANKRAKLERPPEKEILNDIHNNNPQNSPKTRGRGTVNALQLKRKRGNYQKQANDKVIKQQSESQKDILTNVKIRLLRMYRRNQPEHEHKIQPLGLSQSDVT